jgi:hypothetical protein
MQLDHGHYLSVTKRSWAQMKRQGFPEASEPDDDDGDQEEEESDEAPDESAVPKGMDPDRGDPDDRGSEPGLLSFLINYLTRSMEQDADVPERMLIQRS